MKMACCETRELIAYYTRERKRLVASLDALVPGAAPAWFAWRASLFPRSDGGALYGECEVLHRLLRIAGRRTAECVICMMRYHANRQLRGFDDLLVCERRCAAGYPADTLTSMFDGDDPVTCDRRGEKGAHTEA